VDFETLGDRREVDDLSAFVTTWGDRFDADDFLLLGRGYLKRLRPVQAEDWALRLEQARADSPDSHALMLAVADALGDDARAAQAAEKLWQEPGPNQGWTAWTRAGDVLTDVQRYEDARKAYLVASKRPDADQHRDLLNLKLAQVSAGLCDFKDADDHLDDYIKWHEDDARANEVAVTIARQTGDWPSADKHLAALEAGQSGTWAAYVHNRYETLRDQVNMNKDQGRNDEARRKQDETLAFLESVSKHEYSDFAVLDWCATRASENQSYALATSIWEGMIQSRPDSATPHVGLSSLHYLRGFAAAGQGNGEDAGRLFQQSADEARRAIELDPLYYQSHYNLAVALQYSLLLEPGEANLTVVDFKTILDPLQTTLRLDGLQPLALNNAAWIIARMVEKDRASASIAEAENLILRSTRLQERGRAGACKLDDDQLLKLAQSYDTLRDVEEVKGDAAAALQAARAALAALPTDDLERQQTYGEIVAKLEKLAGR
jgi:predicted negative regulator of RcsB-dependent stress response